LCRASFTNFTPIREQDPYIANYNHNHQEAYAEGKEAFWQFDEAIGEGRFFVEQTTIRLKALVSQERYHRSDGAEIVPLRAKRAALVFM
jgi:hypothetical protein